MILPDSFHSGGRTLWPDESTGSLGCRKRIQVIAQCIAEQRQGPLAMCAINLSGITIGDEAFLALSA
jgi:hypothetical protein